MSHAAAHEKPAFAYGEAGIVITGLSPIMCKVKHPNPPDNTYPKQVAINCTATINGRIANGSSSMHYRIRAWFSDLNNKKGHLPSGAQVSDLDRDALPVVVGNGDFGIHLESYFSDENGVCPVGTYPVNEIHLEAVFDLASGVSESYIDDRKGRVTLVCNG